MERRTRASNKQKRFPADEDGADGDDGTYAASSGDETATPARKKARPRAETVRAKARPSAPSKMESVQDRMLMYFGNRTSELVRGIDVRDVWVNDHVLRADKMTAPAPPPDSAPEGSQQTSMLTEEQAQRYMPPTDQELACELGETEFRLAAYGVRTLASLGSARDGALLHCGGYVTSAEWTTDGEAQYLAVAVVSQASEFSAPSLLPMASPGVVQIWRFEGAAGRLGEPTLDVCLLHDWGTPWTVRWCPGGGGGGRVGVLAGAFQDGRARVVEVRRGAKYVHVDQPLRTLELPGVAITSVAWCSAGAVAVGCANGMVATFNVAAPDAAPTACEPVHFSYVFAVAAARPNFAHFVCSTAADGNTAIVDTRDTRCAVFTPRTKSYAQVCAWSPHVQSLIALEDPVTTKASALRKASTGVSVTRHQATVMSLATTECHPFLLSGAADGKVKMGNLVSRCLVSKRQVYKDWFQVQLFALSYSEKSGTYRFTESYAAEAVTGGGDAALRDQLVFPETVCVSAVAWCTDPAYGGWYAAGMANGLLRVEDAASR
ncbi:uncharacterized protein V1510DRAFT_447231 [Dipodascopsis tothii]|uniref:uncharacterized protein n=1 Tax=Dipodascopsis tothii TaxID=44089 RepID=UPI0034CFC771